MANNLLQIKRTSVSGRAANTTHIPNAGEIAINMPDQIMYSTDGATVFEIGANVDTQVVRTALYVGDNVDITTTGLFVGNTSVNLIANSSILKLANSTVNTYFTIPTSAQYSSDDYFLHANGSWVQVISGEGSVRVYQSYTATASQTVFAVSGGYTVNQIEVFRNGVHLANTEYSQDGSNVTLNEGVLEGDIIEVSGWIAMASYSPAAGGSNTQIQFNDSTALGGSDGLVFNKATNTVTIANTLTVRSISANGSIGDTGDVLKSDGANTYWGTVEGGSIGGSNTYVLFNDSTVANGVAGFTFAKDTNNALIANTLTIGTATINSTKYSQTANNADYLGGLAAANYANTSVASFSTSVNSALFTTTGFKANTVGVYPASNTVGQLWGNTIARPEITANSITLSGIATLAGQVANSTGFYPTSNTVGDVLGNTISRWVITANSITTTSDALIGGLVNATSFTTTGFIANTTGTYPASNSSGQNFGNTLARWVITANSITLTGNVSSVGASFSGQANAASFTTTGFLANTIGVYPTSNSSGQNFGNTISRWVITANSAELTGSINALSYTVGSSSVVNSSVISSGGSLLSANIQISACTTTSYTLLASDSGKVVTMDNGSAMTVTIPAGLPIGFRCQVLRKGAGTCTLSNTGQTGCTLHSRTGAYAITSQWGSASVFEESANSYIIDGLV